jgi:hypothetical protein
VFFKRESFRRIETMRYNLSRIWGRRTVKRSNKLRLSKRTREDRMETPKIGRLILL